MSFLSKSLNLKYSIFLFLSPVILIIFLNKSQCKLASLPQIEKWWFEKERQKSIKSFCNNMCKYENKNFNGDRRDVIVIDTIDTIPPLYKKRETPPSYV